MRGARDHGLSRANLGKWIVAAQLALSLVLLIAAGLLVRTLSNLMTIDPGFDRRNVVVVTAKPPRFVQDLGNAPPRAALFDAMTERLQAMPGVSSVARAYTTPMVMTTG